MENTFKKTVLHIKDIGKMIYNTEKVQKYGKIRHNTKVTISVVKKKAKEDCNLQMDLIMKGSLRIILSMNKANLFGIMARRMKDLGLTTK